MNRMRGRAGIAVVGVALLAAPAARADVLAVDGTGAHWIAGGPAQPGVAAHRHAAMAPPAWRPVIAALAERYDLAPAVIEALIAVESGWRADAVSPKGARGLAQLMPATARAMGVNSDDPVQNVTAGARLLHMLMLRFGGNLDAALAAYNAGSARVEAARGVPAIAETRAYVAAIMARLAARANGGT